MKQPEGFDIADKLLQPVLEELPRKTAHELYALIDRGATEEDLEEHARKLLQAEFEGIRKRAREVLAGGAHLRWE